VTFILRSKLHEGNQDVDWIAYNYT
jgi:hypothetical protein